ncbi:MAG: ABC transporter permease [Deferribacteres bacterium]|nr:ABC transporter permease [Deferribacteres bacterium]
MGLFEAVYRFIYELGDMTILLWKTFYWMFRPPFRFRELFKQMEKFGVSSLSVVVITSTFTGMVLALETYTGLKKFNAESVIGSLVAVSMFRELGPVLTALVVTGRAGSAFAAELGTMRVTEQIDALYSMAVDPIHYLVVPRIITGFTMLPILTIISDLLGVAGGYFVSVVLLRINAHTYVRQMLNYTDLHDLFAGIVKAAVFGLLIALVCCYKGYTTRGGAEGVGKATTQAVVISSVLVLVADYFLTSFMF